MIRFRCSLRETSFGTIIGEWGLNFYRDLKGIRKNKQLDTLRLPGIEELEDETEFGNLSFELYRDFKDIAKRKTWTQCFLLLTNIGRN